MAERGRRPGFTMSNEHRVKIQNSNILNALIEHVEGKREMSATQVSAGLGLLKKIMPDLAASADAGSDGELKPVNRMTDEELEAIAAGRSARVAETAPGAKQLN
ncbi:hypothetical protein [Mesorhizobium sp. WSM4308]|uniref:hypothetical protein n=1 Tax=Mesorhizobium sp. WSM4308 TaxID=2029409 RepID=UPI0011804D7E|nr:hypothetical protein [Mesorhizobium sp. WSM4308]